MSESRWIFKESNRTDIEKERDGIGKHRQEQWIEVDKKLYPYFLHPVLFWRQLKHNNTTFVFEAQFLSSLLLFVYYTRFLFCDPITDFWVLPSRIFKFNLIAVIWISSNSLFQLDFIIIFTLYTLFFFFFNIYIFESNYKLFANF